MPACVLAYSGGLDTSVILGWLQDEGWEVHCVYVDIGQPGEDKQAILQKAKDCGAASARIVDVTEELCRDFAFPVLRAAAKYESIYLLGTSIARPLISKVMLQVAREVGAEAYAHGATGKGNDQCRFQLAAEALQPDVTMIAPWRIKAFRDRFPGRTELLAYCEAKGIPVKATASKPWSSDENVLHVSYEAGKLEELDVCGVDVPDYSMGVSPQEAPDATEEVTVGFERGVPVSVNGETLSPAALVRKANDLAGRNGVGRIDMVENRFVGMKSRGVYEAPGMTLLYEGAPRFGGTDPRPRPAAPPRPARPGGRRTGVLRPVVHPQAGRPVRLHGQSPGAGHRRGHAAALQGQPAPGEPRQPEQPVRRGRRQHGGRRQLRPGRRHRLPADRRPPLPRAGPGESAGFLTPSPHTFTTEPQQNMPTITRPAARLRQGSLTLYTTSLRVSHLAADDFCQINTLDPSEGTGYQRLLQEVRAKRLAEYLVDAHKEQEAFLPTSVFLATSKTLASDEDRNELTIDTEATGPFNVVDGQHRISGLVMAAERDPELKAFEVPANIAVGLNDVSQMTHFLIVNTTQRSVDKAVEQQIVARLTSMVDVESMPTLPKWIRKQVAKGEDARALKIAQYLNEEPSSPWFERIKMANDESAAKGAVTQKSFVTSLKKHILNPSNPISSDHFDADKQQRILLNYWIAVAKVFIEQGDDTSVVLKSNGFTFFHTISPAVFLYLANLRDFKVDVIEKLLRDASANLNQDAASVGTPQFWKRGSKASGINRQAIRKYASAFENAISITSSGTGDVSL